MLFVEAFQLVALWFKYRKYQDRAKASKKFKEYYDKLGTASYSILGLFDWS